MSMISSSTDARRRRYRVATASTQIILEQVMLVACNDIITLNARVVDTSNQPHTYFWEQISGTPVQWLEDQHQLMVMWRQPTDTSEKVFRFWLDRGTAFEKYQDVLVTTLNRDPINLPLLGEQVVFASNGSIDRMISDSSISSMPAPRIEQPDGVLVNADNRAISWINPSNLEYADAIEIDTWKDGTEAQIAIVQLTGGPNSSQYYSGVSANALYRLTNITEQFGIITEMAGKYHAPAPSASYDLDTFDDIQIRIALGDISLVTSIIERSLIQFGASPYDIPNDEYTGVCWCNGGGLSFTQSVIERSLTETQVATSTYSGISLVGDIAFTKTVTARDGVIHIG